MSRSCRDKPVEGDWHTGLPIFRSAHLLSFLKLVSVERVDYFYLFIFIFIFVFCILHSHDTLPQCLFNFEGFCYIISFSVLRFVVVVVVVNFYFVVVGNTVSSQVSSELMTLNQLIHH